jgi:hypothetical protein
MPAKKNLRIMTVNCRSIRDKQQEFKTALHYLNPDVVCATESWLKGVKPRSNPMKDAIKSSDIFPPNYNVYRNDRGTLGGGVFIMLEKSITSVEQTSLITDGEIVGKNQNQKSKRPSYWIILHATQRTKTPRRAAKITNKD